MPTFSSHSQSDDSEREDHTMAAQISALSEQVTYLRPLILSCPCAILQRAVYNSRGHAFRAPCCLSWDKIILDIQSPSVVGAWSMAPVLWLQPFNYYQRTSVNKWIGAIHIHLLDTLCSPDPAHKMERGLMTNSRLHWSNRISLSWPPEPTAGGTAEGDGTGARETERDAQWREGSDSYRRGDCLLHSSWSSLQGNSHSYFTFWVFIPYYYHIQSYW